MFAISDPRTQVHLSKLYNTWARTFPESVLQQVKVSLEKMGYKIDSPAFALAQQQLQEQEERQQAAAAAAAATQQAAVATQQLMGHQLAQQVPYVHYRYAGQQGVPAAAAAAAHFAAPQPQPRPQFVGAAPAAVPPQQQAQYYQSQPHQQHVYGDHHQFYGGHPAAHHQMVAPHHPQYHAPPQPAAYMYQQHVPTAPMAQQPHVQMHAQQPFPVQMQDPAYAVAQQIHAGQLSQLYKAVTAQGALMQAPSHLVQAQQLQLQPTTLTEHQLEGFTKDEAAPPSFQQSFLQSKNEKSLDEMYWDLPYQCGKTGRRFKTDVELRAHVDSLFATEREVLSQKLRSRRVWPTSSVWAATPQLPPPVVQGDTFFGGEKGSGEADAEGKAEGATARGAGGAPSASKRAECSVPVGESNSDGFCALSGEKLEVVWDEEEEEWRYKDCTRLPDGRLVLASLAKSASPAGGKGGGGEAEKTPGATAAAPGAAGAQAANAALSSVRDADGGRAAHGLGAAGGGHGRQAGRRGAYGQGDEGDAQ